MVFKLLFCLKLVLFNVPTTIPMAYMYQDNESKTTLKIDKHAVFWGEFLSYRYHL